MNTLSDVAKLKMEHATAKLIVIAAQMNHDLQRFGEWKLRYNTLKGEVEHEFKRALFQENLYSHEQMIVLGDEARQQGRDEVLDILAAVVAVSDRDTPEYARAREILSQRHT